ncbi:MAG: SagB/ThcOx family dehydrogenase [Synechococcales cyanobacterium CRU_2_2]|nr:SagB/ThcOx family dehydrogenase [Synechococcales cyanobacterium CRU_2_2]
MSPGSFSLAEHYHERTKYDPKTLGQQSRELDWSQQPVPFKDYKIGAVIDLKPYLKSRRRNDAERSRRDRPLLQRLSWLLLCSYGLTQQVQTLDGDRLYLRAAPSAGGLYPAELYLLSAGQPDLPAGLYSYQSNTHTLVNFWSSDCWPQLQRACLWHPSLEHTQLALVSTAVFWRSAWRYQARAYRRIFLDTGHVLGNVELAAALNDFRPHLIGGFVDAQLNQLLYLDEAQEGAIAVAALADLLQVQQNLPLAQAALPSQPDPQYAGDPLGEDELLAALHQSSSIDEALGDRLNWKPIPVLTPPGATPPIQPPRPDPEDKYNFPFCSRFDTRCDPIHWGEDLQYLPQTILQRRSTRAYSGLDLTQAELNQLLDFTYQPEHYRLQGLPEAPDYFALDLIETFVVVSGVEGLEAGCYYYAPKAEELRQIRFKNFRPELHYLCLGQELGRDAGAVVFHTADLHKAVEIYGDRAYRYLHLDAGHLGQRLNLAAIRLGLGVSGIAGFFDDQVNEVLGIPAQEAVLYITTLGRSRAG